LIHNRHQKTGCEAVEAVHISQPAFGRRVEELEKVLGVRLLIARRGA
jgi:DNA-binding transcriptional LysR family regulator